MGKVEFTELPFQIYELETSSASFADVSFRDIRITSSRPVILNISLDLWIPESKALCPPPLGIDLVAGSDQRTGYEERSDKVNLTGIISSVVMKNQRIKGATITLLQPDRPKDVISQVTSDDHGKYDFKDLEPGKYSITASYNGILEKPYKFDFWVTRENLTRIGNIAFGISEMQDSCGMVTKASPAIGPISISPPELIMPSHLTSPRDTKSVAPR